MRYKPEWKGRLRVDASGRVFWDGKKLGHVYSRYKKGAKTKAGMETNMVFFVTGVDAEFETMTAALESLVPAAAPAEASP